MLLWVTDGKDSKFVMMKTPHVIARVQNREKRQPGLHSPFKSAIQ
jgi:hypothetical protein